jgi:succinoglycan biosynthesis transport protein ExoP
MDAIRTQPEGSAPSGQPQRQQGSPDLLKILWRWKWLPLLGTLIGLTIGYLLYEQQPPQYKAVALLHVQSPERHMAIDAMRMGVEQPSPKTDELVVIRSTAVLRNAMEVGKLSQQPKLANMAPEAIVGWLKNKKVLETKLGSTDPNSEIVQIGVTTNDAELSATVLESIVIGYEQHVSKQIENSSFEAIKAMSKYSETYESRKSAAEAGLKKIRDNRELIWIDGKPIDPQANKLLSLQEEILRIDTRKRNIESLLQQLESSKEAGRPVEEMLRLIASAASGILSTPSDMTKVTQEKSNLQMMRQSMVNFEDNVVTPARIQLEQEMSKWDKEHPTVKVLQGRIDKLESELRKKEEAYEKALQNFAELEGSTAQDSPNMETQFNSAVGALIGELSKLSLEKSKYEGEIETITPQMQTNAEQIGNFLLFLSELEGLGKTTTEITEALNKLNVSLDNGHNTVRRLEVQTLGAWVGPRIELYLGIGALLGFASFFGIAYLLELADRSYRSPDEIAADLGMPIIGHLPLTSLARNKRVDEKVDNSIVTLHKARSSVSEAFRGIRTAVFFGSQQGAIKVIQVTSPVPGDGKSTIAANLAVSISQAGRRVCIVDCDFRRPRVAKILGLREDLGLVQVINGKATLDDAVQATTIENLSAVTCGRRPGNPAELLASERFQQLIQELRDRFDYVIVDTPPILVVSDPAAVATNVDGVILTIRLRRNLKPIATRAAQMLHSMNANMLGVVVNGIGVGGHGYGYGGYRYDAYNSNSSGGYGQSGYGGYGYGATYQYGGYYGGSMIGRDYYSDQVPKPIAKG